MKRIPHIHTKRLSAAFLLGSLALLLAAPASAGRQWCAKDPIVSIDGTTVQIWVAIPQEFQRFVTDTVEVKISAPKQLPRKVLYTDDGFNGHGEKVDWGDITDPNTKDKSFPLAVDVRVKFDGSRMEKYFGKAALEAELGKDLEVPVQVTVNIGEVTQSFETHVQYGTADQTKFVLSVVKSDAVVN